MLARDCVEVGGEISGRVADDGPVVEAEDVAAAQLTAA
jgi:hypothetical protein